MKLLRLEIVGFGALREQSYDLASGLNVLCHANGWGKSTLAVFIKAMLYGLPASRKSSLDENERKKYRPWAGGRYGGSLEFSTAKGEFRVERFFGTKEAEDSFLLIDLATNLPSEAYRDAPLGVELFGIDEEGFERSVYLSQRQLAPAKEGGSIHAKLSAALENVEDLSDYDCAMELLDKRRRFYQLKGDRGAISDLQTTLGETLRRLERAGESAKALTERRRMLFENEEACRHLREEIERLEKQRASLALREARASLEKEKNDRLAELAALNERRAREEAFLGEQIPTDAELKAAVRTVDLLEKKQWECHSLASGFAGEEELLRLSVSFAGGIPAAQTLESLAEEHRRLTAATARRDALRSTTGDGGLLQKVPVEQDLRRAEHLAGQCESLRRTLDEAPAPGKRKKILGGVGLALGLALAVVGALTLGSAVGIPLLVAGGILLAVGGLLLALHGTAVRRRQAERAERERTYRQAREELVRFLLSYGRTVEDPIASVHSLRHAAAQAEKIRETLARYDREIASLRERLGKYFAGQGEAPSSDADYGRAIEALGRRRERLRILKQEREGYLSRRREAGEARARLAEELAPFLSRYPAVAGMGEKEALSTVIRHYEEYQRVCAEMEARDSALRRFIAENLPAAEEGQAPLPSAAEIEERRSACREEIAKRTAESDRLRAEVRRLEEDADALSELTARAEREERTLVEYKANLTTIQNVDKYLTEARDALSTRYLAGMQESFDAAIAQLPEGTLPEARLDRSFDVWTRSHGETHPEESLSRGLRDAVQFCVRLALVKALFADGEVPFLLLDDPFVNLDDERLAAVKEMLERFAEEYQILHLVCSASRI